MMNGLYLHRHSFKTLCSIYGMFKFYVIVDENNCATILLVQFMFLLFFMYLQVNSLLIIVVKSCICKHCTSN